MSAELLEQQLGGAAKPAYMLAAPKQLSQLLAASVAPYEANPPSDAFDALARRAVGAFRDRMSEQARAILESADGKDYAVDVQNAILAFAGRVLLKGCDLRFERGQRYGLIGQNGVGKTTLLNRLAAKDITGFPQELRVWYIRHEVVCDDGVSVRAFMAKQASVSSETVTKTLDQVGFPEALQLTDVNNLSGGWKMKLSIAISILHRPELLLLDEPTNHLDRAAVEWLTRHLLSLEGVTICVVSHDYDFIESVVNNVVHYDNGGQAGKPCRLVYYPMGFKSFQELKPEIAAGLPTADKAMMAMAGSMAGVVGEGSLEEMEEAEALAGFEAGSAEAAELEVASKLSPRRTQRLSPRRTRHPSPRRARRLSRTPLSLSPALSPSRARGEEHTV